MRRPQNWKKSPTCFDKAAVLLSSVKTSGTFFQIFVGFSEKLNFSKVKQVEQLETRPLCTKELHDGYKNCFSSQLEE